MAIATAAAVLAAGCALKPPPTLADVRAGALPQVRPPAEFGAATGAPGAVPGRIADDWLATFADPQLDALVREALQHNADLQVAATRVEQAAGYARLAGSPVWPTVDLVGRTSTGGGDSGGLSGGGLVVNWELDLWGRLRYGQAAAEAQLASSEADFAYARQSIAAMVAKSWFLAVEARMQRALVAETIAAAERLLNLASERRRVGVGDDFDVAQSEATLQGFRDTARSLDLSYRNAVRALELLVGRYPAAELQVPERFAPMPGPVPVGLPSELLERRPDVIAAERRVAAAFSRVEEARTARLPRIALTANVTSVSSELFVLQNSDNPVWSVGANLLWPLFNAGALRTQQEIRTAEQKQAFAGFAQTGIRAFGEIENALSGEFASTERAAILARAVAENERALELAGVRYRVGSSDLRAVLQQQIALFNARSLQLRMEAERRIQRVNVHLALGGSFEGATAIVPVPVYEPGAPLPLTGAPSTGTPSAAPRASGMPVAGTPVAAGNR